MRLQPILQKRHLYQCHHCHGHGNSDCTWLIDETRSQTFLQLSSGMRSIHITNALCSLLRQEICFSWVKGLLHLPIWDRAAWTSFSAMLGWVCAPHSSIKWVAATCKTDEGRRSAHIQVKKELTPAYATTLQVCAGSNNIALSGSFVV